MPTLHLTDIIPLEDLQRLQDDFVDMAHVASIIVDVDGTPITKPSNFTNFCKLMRSNPSTNSNCEKSDNHLGMLSYATQEPVQGVCRNLGLLDASAPIVIEGHHVANWMIGQSRVSPRTEGNLREFGRVHGLDEKTLQDAYYAIPRLSDAGFSTSLKLVGLFSSHLSDVCYKNTLLRRADIEKTQIIGVMQTVLANVDIVMYVNDPATHRLVYANEYLCKLLGREQVVGELCYEALQGRDSPCTFCPQKYLFDKNGQPLVTSYKWEYANPLLGRFFEITDRMVPWADGSILHMEVALDVTDRKALANAEESNRAKRDFLARMSHELRTPMNGVLGMTHLALQAGPPPDQLNYLKKIQSSASLLLGIINDILDFSRIEAGKMDIESVQFNLPEMVENLLTLILPKIEEKGIDLRFDIDSSLPEMVQGDSLRLSQVLLNLLGNSAKFTSSGNVTLAMRGEQLSDDVLSLNCQVSDTGIGMHSDQLVNLFNPFTQADSTIVRQFGGTGLGLSISKALVELMGGVISVKSIPGEGSAFYFNVLLQLHSTTDTSVPVQQISGGQLDLTGKLLLLVEDNEINQEIGVALLENMGALVDVASNGVEGVQRFMQKDYDAILMDIRMPEMDGYTATSSIRHSGKHDFGVPIIAMTANAMAEDRKASSDAGMNGHISKPIAIDQLVQELSIWLTSDRAPGYAGGT